MEGFTIGLALVDAIPVLSFGISMVIIATRFDSALFMIGASLSVLAGCCKVAEQTLCSYAGHRFSSDAGFLCTWFPKNLMGQCRNGNDELSQCSFLCCLDRTDVHHELVPQA